jgi:hypothetical protein
VPQEGEKHCQFNMEKVKEIAVDIRDFSMFGDNSPIAYRLI